MAQEQGYGVHSLVVLLALVGALSAPHLKSGSASEAKSDESHTAARVPDASSLDLRLKGALGGLATTSIELTGSMNPTPEKLSLDERLANAFRELGHDLSPDRVRSDSGKVEDVVRRLDHRPELVPLIVGVPDPQQSHMALYYDQMLVALREAAAHIGYVPGEFRIPWQEGLRRHSNSGSEPPAPLSLAQEGVPGMMLFRREAPTEGLPTRQEEVLVVLLVTESPVLGANVEQLETALRFSVKLSPDVRVLGPFFSGSAASLNVSLTKYPGAFVATGTATSSAVDAAFPKDIRFHRVVPTDDSLLAFVQQQFDALADSPDHRGKTTYFARLSESGTVYGQDVSPRLTPSC